MSQEKDQMAKKREIFDSLPKSLQKDLLTIQEYTNLHSLLSNGIFQGALSDRVEDGKRFIVKTQEKIVDRIKNDQDLIKHDQYKVQFETIEERRKEREKEIARHKKQRDIIEE